MTAIMTHHVELNRGHFKLADISVSIPQGKMTAIVGPNGSGKSTMLKLITRLLVPDGGEVWIGQRQAKEYAAKELATTVSMLPQSRDWLPELTVRELVAYGRSPHKGMFRSRLTPEDTEVIEWALDITGTRRHEGRMLQTLSGGEQQKARIAMALAQKTDILLLDEPTTYLDIAHQLDVMETLQRINQEYGITVLLVLHDLQQAAHYCDHLIAMKQGRIVTSGQPESLLTREFFQHVYEIDAKIKFEDGYPVIVPLKTKRLGECDHMVIVTNTSKIKPGNAHLLIERFDRVGKVEEMEGFLGLEVMLTQNTKEFEEVTVSTRWVSKDAFQAWTRSSAFKESHAHRNIPDYILDNKISFYDVKIVRNPLPVAAGE